MAAVLGGYFMASSALSRKHTVEIKDMTEANILRISNTFGIPEKEVEQVFLESLRHMNIQRTTASKQPNQQAKDGGMER